MSTFSLLKRMNKATLLALVLQACVVHCQDSLTQQFIDIVQASSFFDTCTLVWVHYDNATSHDWLDWARVSEQVSMPWWPTKVTTVLTCV